MNFTSAQPFTFLQFPKMNLLKVSDSANFDQKDKVFNKRELYFLFVSYGKVVIKDSGQHKVKLTIAKHLVQLSFDDNGMFVCLFLFYITVITLDKN